MPNKYSNNRSTNHENLYLSTNSETGMLFISSNIESKRIVISNNILDGEELILSSTGGVIATLFYRADTTLVTADNAVLTLDYRI